MPAATKKYSRIRGLMLAQAPVDTEDLFVVSGRNFMPRLEGPESWFASEFNSLEYVDYGFYVDFFRHTGQSIIISERGVWNINADCSIVKCFNICAEEKERCNGDFCYPWSHAYVGETHFYSHPSVGLISFDTFTNEWEHCSRESLGFTDLIFGITASNLSLIVLSRDTVTWSGVDDGKLINDDMYVGSGSQNLHLAQNGRPLGVYSDGTGFFTFTSNGIMYSSPMSSSQVLAGESVEDLAVFHHSTFDVDEFMEVPIGPCAITKVSKSKIAFVSNKGIYEIGRFDNNQFTAQALDPTMNRWFREDLFKCMDYTACCALRLFYDGQEGFLYVSIVDTFEPYTLYNEALVYDFELKEWGVFSHKHRVVGETNFNGDNASNTGYIDHIGLIKTFRNDEYNYTWSEGNLINVGVDSWINVGIITTTGTEGDTEYLYEISEITIETGSCPRNEFEVSLHSGNSTCVWKDAICDTEPLYLKDRESCRFNYSCSNQGLYHILRLTARNALDYFALKRVRLITRKKGRV